MLVVEGEGGGAFGDATQSIKVGVRAEDDVGGDLGRRFVGADREDAQGLAEGDGGLGGHAGELSAADHGDDGWRGGAS